MEEQDELNRRLAREAASTPTSTPPSSPDWERRREMAERLRDFERSPGRWWDAVEEEQEADRLLKLQLGCNQLSTPVLGFRWAQPT